MAGGDQLLHVAVVDGGSGQLAVAQEVGPRLSPTLTSASCSGVVGSSARIADQRRQGGAHALLGDVVVCGLEDRRVRFEHRRDHDVDVAGPGGEPVAEMRAASALATSPAWWPPIPSATPNTIGSAT